MRYILLAISAFLCISLISAQTYNFDRHFGNRGDGKGQFNLPHDVTYFSVFDSTTNVTTNRIAVADTLNNRVQVLDLYGAYIREFGTPGNGTGSLAFPQGIAALYDNVTYTIFVSDTQNHRIQIAYARENLTAHVGSLGASLGQFISPKGVAVSKKYGILFVSDSGNHRIQALNATSFNVLYTFGSFGIEKNQLRDPTGVAYMENFEQVIVVDRGNKLVKIWKVNSTAATFQSVVSEEFEDPTYVTTSSRNNYFWVTDFGASAVKVFDRFGDFYAQYGRKAGSGKAEFSGPLGLADDPVSNYTVVVDAGNSRIQIVNSEPELTQTTTDLAGVLTTLGINVLIALVFFVGFLVCRRIGRFKKFYESNCMPFEEDPWRGGTAPQPPPGNPFKLLKRIIMYSEDEVFHSHGLDAWVYLKFLKYCLLLVSIYGIYGVCVILIINIVAGTNKSLPKDSVKYVTGIEILSMANISRGSSYLWCHMVGVVFNTVATMYLMKRFYDQYLVKRLEYIGNPNFAENYSAMITEIPIDALEALTGIIPGIGAVTKYTNAGIKAVAKKTSELSHIPNLLEDGDVEEFNDAKIKAYLNPAFNNQVKEVHRVQIIPKVKKLHHEREELVNKLETALAEWTDKGERPTHKPKLVLGDAIDSIDYFTSQLKKKDEALKDILKDIDNHSSPTGTAFVTFETISEASKMAQTKINKTWLVGKAPELRDIIWENLVASSKSKFFRTLAVLAIVFAIIFFYTIPIVAIQGVATIQNLAKLPGLKFLDKALNPAIQGFITGYIPVILLIIFMAILVPVLRFLSSLQQPPTQSELERSTSVKYLCFLVFNVLLVSTIAGAIMIVLNDVLEEPQSIVGLLAASLPKQASFFINYIITTGLSGTMMQLWRPVPLVIALVMEKFLAKTKRAKRIVWQSQPFEYAVFYASTTLILLIVQIYATLAPFILPFALLYFCLTFVSHKYNIIWADRNPYEGGGNFFTSIFISVNAGLILYQLMSIGVFASYSFPYGAIVTTTLVLTVAFVIYMFYLYSSIQTYGTLVDLPTRPPPSPEDGGVELENSLLDPLLKAPKAHINPQDQGNGQVPYQSDLASFKLKSEILSGGESNDVELGSEGNHGSDFEESKDDDNTREEAIVPLETTSINENTSHEDTEDIDFIV